MVLTSGAWGWSCGAGCWLYWRKCIVVILDNLPASCRVLRVRSGSVCRREPVPHSSAGSGRERPYRSAGAAQSESEKQARCRATLPLKDTWQTRMEPQACSMHTTLFPVIATALNCDRTPLSYLCLCCLCSYQMTVWVEDQ